MLKKFLFTAVAILIMAAAFSQTKVALIPTLHHLHTENIFYNYDSLKAVIKRIDPDIIAVEIRDEDVNTDTAYQKKNYPFEMWMSKVWFPSVIIEGFDWLGSQIEGKAIPEKYWQNESRIKALEKLLSIDTVYQRKLESCKIYSTERLKILSSMSLKEILKSSDAMLVKIYYNCFNQQVRNSDYEELADFYNLRNVKMQQRLDALLEKHQNKKIVVLTGDDHYPYLLEHLRKRNIVLLQP